MVRAEECGRGFRPLRFAQGSGAIVRALQQSKLALTCPLGWAVGDLFGAARCQDLATGSSAVTANITSGTFGRSYGWKASSLPLDDRPRERQREQPDKFPDLSVARMGIAPILGGYRNLVFICTFYARD